VLFRSKTTQNGVAGCTKPMANVKTHKDAREERSSILPRNATNLKLKNVD
jgi:hypothetical protein